MNNDLEEKVRLEQNNHSNEPVESIEDKNNEDKSDKIENKENVDEENSVQFEEKANVVKEKKPLKISFAILLISYVPYLYMIYGAIFGLDFFGMCYGMEGVMVAAMVGVVTGVYPVALLYQIIYGIVNRKRFTKLQRKLVIIAASLAFGLVVVVCSVELVLEYLHGSKEYEEGYPIVDAYLKESFTEDNYKDMEIEKLNPLRGMYYVNTPLLEHGFIICLDESRSKVESSAFFEDLCEEKNLDDEISESLTKKYFVSKAIRIEVDDESIKLKDGAKYDNLQNILDVCEYTIDEIVMEMNEYDREEMLNNIKEFYTKNGKNLESYMIDGAMFTFKINIDDEEIGYVHVIKKSDTVLKLEINGYSDQILMPNEDESIEYDLITGKETFIKNP